LLWEGADFCVAPIVEKFHVPCASLIRSTLGRCKLSELISTDLLSKGSSLNRDVQFLLCHERCRVTEFRIVSNRQVLYLQAWRKYTQMHIAQHDSPIEAFFKF